MHPTYFAFPLLAAISLGACDMDRGHNKAAADPVAIEKDIRGIETQWMADYGARDVDKLTGHYSDDAAIANPGAPLAADTAARRACRVGSSTSRS